MVKLHPGFSHLMFTYTNLLSCIATVEGIMMVVESLVPNYLMGVVVGTRALVRKLLQLFVLHKFHLLFTNCLHRHHHSSTPRGIVRHRKR
nr:TPA_asm: hypothetical protein HUJ06_008265 [Nelumbo nucifera]